MPLLNNTTYLCFCTNKFQYLFLKRAISLFDQDLYSTDNKTFTLIYRICQTPYPLTVKMDKTLTQKKTSYNNEGFKETGSSR